MAEVAGVVLALPPLMISFLEHYRECFEVYDTWRKFVPVYRRCQTQIDMVELDIWTLKQRLLLPEDLDSKTLQLKLQERLDERVQPVYLRAFEDVRESIDKLRTMLSLDVKQLQDMIEQQKGSFVDKVQYQVLRLRFSGSQKPREAAFAGVRVQLQALNGLLTSNDQIVQQRADMKQRHSNKPLLAFWHHAKRLHKLIMDSWCCACSGHHCADLQLVHRAREKVKIDLDFVYSDGDHQGDWKRVQACVSTAEVAGQGRVQFESEVLVPIDDMCQTLDKVKISSMNGLLEGDTAQYKVVLCSIGDKYGLQHREMQSLHTMLEQLNRYQRYCLAIVLASSQVQLHHSGWLSEWDARDILFKGTTPFLRHRFDTCEPSFESLGIILLELCFGCVLEKCPYTGTRTERAWRWLDDVEGDTGEAYAYAVEWCLRTTRVRKDSSSWKDDFLAAVLSNLQKTTDAQWPKQMLQG